MPGAGGAGATRADRLAFDRRRPPVLDRRRNLLPGGGLELRLGADPIARGRGLPAPLPAHLRGPDRAPARADRQLPRHPLDRRADRRARRGRADRGPRARPDRRRRRRRLGRRSRHRPRLSDLRSDPADAGRHRRRLHRLAPRTHLVAARRRPHRPRHLRRRLPARVGRRAPTSKAACLDVAWPLGALLLAGAAWVAGADRPASASARGMRRHPRSRSPPRCSRSACWRGERIDRLPAAARSAGARHPAPGDRAARHLAAPHQRKPPDHRARGADRRAHRPRQPPRADGRPRRAATARRRATAEPPAGDVRPRRLQALQRHLRPSGRRRAAGAAGRDARRRRRRHGGGLPARRRRVLRARRVPRRRASTRSSRGAAAALSEHGEGFDDRRLATAASCCRARPTRRRRRCSSPTSACTRTRAREPHLGGHAVARRPARALCASASPRSHEHLATWPSWPSRSPKRWG